ncbi:isoquinoline 1-oxidoreductase, beta subunit [Cognatiyoonia koreensis]|uniref:Isoquinoline 1-oxidoreductase, beta subunit n=1 Tax=Cognatiyoonia koreensis TaxID=364200 RepID=A0A1I0QNV0_9RHOB|nr:molybdopterin cofactor-binding domain-containing protein [Cognatiyoonia koreensis]SEW29095.1 isoquinoline 1-oxidoreductase, beta subunit [Cognatiyoonia koreensis]
MGRLRTISRRTFLIGSTAVLGGVAFGTFAANKPYDNPLLADLGDGEASFNPFVKITDETITLIVNHADSGQGVQSAQAALIAEELDVDLDQVTLSFGHPDPAYYNAGFAAEAVPFMSFDRSLPAQTMRGLAADALKLLGLQGTGGSTSMPDQYVKLRTAGAVARETLKLAASAQSGVPVAELTTAGGAVQLPDGTALTYQSLAAQAAQIEPVKDVTLRDPGTWRLLGKPMQRTDSVAKSTGTETYGIDLKVDGMVHAAVRMNPRKGGAMNGYDATAAEGMRGVSQVIPLANGAAVIANNTWRAITAVNAIDFDWGPAPYPAEQDDHWQAVAASFTDDRLDKEWRADGDVDSALTDVTVIEAEYRAPYVAHQPLEPIGAIVRVDENGAEVWAGHQLPGFLTMKVADIVGCPIENVVFHNQMIGGSFGHRLEFENITLATEIAKQLLGTPVKLTFSREEDFAQDFTRQIGMSRSRGAIKDGKVDSWALDIATPSPVASQGGRMGQAVPGPDMQIVSGAWNMPYAIPHLRVRGYRVPELAPISSWRSVGASTAGFFAESFLDEMIHAAGADPLEERLRLCNHPVHRAVLETIGEMSNWGSDMGENRGRGIAIVESFGVPTAEVVEVTMTDRGIKLDKVYVVADVGQIIDPVNLESQLSGGAIWGLGHAINAEITYADGIAEQENFYTHDAMRMFQCPDVAVKALENADMIRGAGEPGVPPAPAALANAIFAATGQRLREMPFNKFIDFA